MRLVMHHVVVLDVLVLFVLQPPREEVPFAHSLRTAYSLWGRRNYTLMSPENIQYPSQDGEDKADILYLISFYYSLHCSRTTYRLQVYQCGTNLIPNLEDSKLAMRIGHCRIRVCWVLLMRLSCLYTSEIVWPAVMLFGSGAVYLTTLYSFHAIQAAYKPFSQFPSRLASFQICLTWFLNGTTLLYWNRAKQLRNWMTGLQIVQVCNQFMIMSTASHLLLSLSARVYGPHSCVLTSCTVMCIAFSEGGSCIHIYSIVPKNFGHCLCTLPFDSSK